MKLNAIADRAMKHFATMKEGVAIALIPPAVMELGNSTGFDFFLQDLGGHGHEALMDTMNKFLDMAHKDPRLTMVRHNGMDDEPEFKLIIDDERARSAGVSIDDINTTMSSAWGSSYINQFMYHDRVKRVYIQGRADSRFAPKDLNNWYVRNNVGTMVPFSAFGSGKWIYGSPRYERFNGIAAVEIMGSPAKGYSSGDATKAVLEIAKKLPQDYRIMWHSLSYEEQLSGSQTTTLYTISVIIVFLCLAALYESWTVPICLLYTSDAADEVRRV